jgi:iron complex transport system ATP-binding protein
MTAVGFAYGERRAISGISMAIGAGDFVSLIGPNGSGKSTLLKLMSGVLEPTQGTLELMGRPMPAWPLTQRAKTVAVVSSDEGFIFPFTVDEIVSMGRTPYIEGFARETDEDRAIVQQSMESTDVRHLRERSINELSSGERQRVLLARALAQESQILLLDEPTTHLDIGHEWALFDLLSRLHQEKKLTVVCAMHDLALAARYSNHLVLLRDGRTAAVGDPRDVLTQDTLQNVFAVPLSVAWLGDNEKSLILTPPSKGKLS